MRLTYVHLENIKSYQDARIDLTPGLNAICGANGSGKTTILEAIGYALFDYLLYNQNAFVREGARYGTIRVGLIGADEREYEVVRRVGSGSTYYVMDVDANIKLVERKEAVRDWIRAEALDVDREVDLEALFKNAVGVPQGLMTADFTRATADRKRIFDPLLAVEEYEAAWKNLLDTDRYLRDRSAELEVAIGRLDTDVSRIPSLAEEVAGIRAEIEGLDEQMNRLAADREQLEARLTVFAAAESDLRAAVDAAQGARYQAERLRDGAAHRREAWQNAVAAREVTTATGKGYEAVRAADAELEVWETERRERDRLDREFLQAQSERDGIFRTIENLDRQRVEAVQAGSEAATLTAVVERQTDLERRRQESERAVDALRRLEADLRRQRESAAAEQNALRAVETRIAAVEADRPRAEQLPGLERELTAARQALHRLDTLRGQWEPLMQRGKQLRQRRDRLREDVSRREKLGARLATIAGPADEMERLRHRQSEIRERRAAIEAAQGYEERARRELGTARCPLLALECPVVAADPAALTRLDAGFVALQTEDRALVAELAEMAPRLDEATRAANEAPGLRAVLKEFTTLDDDLNEVEAELRICLKEHEDLKAELDGEAATREQVTALEAQVAGGRRAVESLATLPALAEQRDGSAGRLATLEVELQAREGERETLAGASAGLERITAELLALNDPRGRQQSLLARAGRLAEIERETATHQEQLGLASDRVKALSANLQRFDGLDERGAALKARREAHREEYDLYVGHRKEAALVEERAAALAAAEKECARAETTYAGAVRREEEARSRYDAATHAEAQQELNGVEAQTQSTTRIRSDRAENLRRQEAELARLRAQEERLRARQAELGQVGRIARAVDFVRHTIRAAGPAVTEALLRVISAGANDIYAEIVDDHAAELRWERDYEVVVQRGTENRSFIQLSGGEQMSAALAIRLALLKEMSEVDFAFFDEPTQNMDIDRRSNLADQIGQIKGFEQLVVISHDDTFEHQTDNLIRLRKEHEATRLDGH